LSYTLSTARIGEDCQEKAEANSELEEMLVLVR
jgi:hypothetical protein